MKNQILSRATRGVRVKKLVIKKKFNLLIIPDDS